MKTETLIEALGRSTQPVDYAKRRFAVALLIGGVFASGVAVALLGMRPDLATARAAGSPSRWGSARRSSRWRRFIGANRTTRRRGPSVPLSDGGPVSGHRPLAAAVLAGASPAHRDGMVKGQEWVECLVSIPLIAVVPFAAVIWNARRATPRTSSEPARSPASSPAASVRWRMRALHRRLTAVRDRLVQRHDRALYACRRTMGTASASLVSQRFTST
jgi:hypothetical protein